MDLSVLERLLLLGVLPAEGDITTLRIVRQLQDDLSFSEQEHADFKIAQADGRVTWDRTTERLKAVTIGPKALGLIAEALRKLSDQKKLQPQHIDLYERFVEAGE